MFRVAGNIIVKSHISKILTKVENSGLYDSHEYFNLYKVADELNKPHFDRIKNIFQWLEIGKKTHSEPKPKKKGEPLTSTFNTVTSFDEEFMKMVAELESLVPKKAVGVIHEDKLTQEKLLWLQAYNSYYDMYYTEEDVQQLI